MRCSNCGLVFVPKSYHLNSEDEKAVYDLHQNNVLDEGYRLFLSRITDPLSAQLAQGACGLDFGCGPGPALSKMMEENGFKMSLYDPYYENNHEMLQQRWDFITATEVAEHLSSPGKEFRRLFTILNDCGTLAIMTKLVIDREAFTRWHYIHDQTHICFYSRETFKYIAAEFNTEIEFIGNDVILMRKK